MGFFELNKKMIGGSSYPFGVPFLKNKTFSPKHYDCRVWFSASMSSVFFDGNNKVAQWTDISGYNRHATQSSAAYRPTFTATGFSGGYPAINFSGSGLQLKITRGFIKDRFSIFAVFSGGNVNSRVIDQRGTGTFGTVKGYQFKNYQSVSGDIAGVDDGAGNHRGYNVSGLTDSPAMISSVFPENNTLSYYRNGLKYMDVASAGGNVPTDIDNTGFDIALGGITSGGTTQDFTGLIAEMIMYNHTLSSVERKKVEGYLAHKWGLAGNLPVDHPYQTVAP